MIKLGGRRASLAGLNRILTGIEGVLDGQFVAPEDLDRRPTARLLVFVVAPERTADDILAALRGRIDPPFLPRRVIRVDGLPRNEVGKLTDRALGALRAPLGDALSPVRCSHRSILSFRTIIPASPDTFLGGRSSRAWSCWMLPWR